jgi:heterodisulfide reductase subunit C
VEDKTELKNGKKDELLENNVNEITINKKTTIDELLIVLDVITKGTKIIENSKKVEEIKSLFYIKIKEQETKKEDEKIEEKTSDERLFKEKLNLYKLKKKNI